MCLLRNPVILVAILSLLSTAALARSSNGNRKPQPPIKGDWKVLAAMTDEFDGKSLDSSRWHPNNPAWLGRQPAYFWPGNVSVSDGKLHLRVQKQDLPDLPEGYHTWTSAAVKSKTKVLYGYFEIRCKPIKGHVVSAFWFYDDTPEIWTEIDVFEMSQYPGKEKAVQTTVHVFRSPTTKEHWSKSEDWQMGSNVAEDWHTYALEWDKKSTKFYVDGKVIRTVENTDWHQPLYLNFDVETMPQFDLVPRDNEVPASYDIEYVRAWQRK